MTDPAPTRPAVLLLAAGSARRFGSDKRFALLYKQKTLLEVTLRCYRAAGFEVFLCLSARSSDDGLADRLAAPGVVVLRCQRAAEGMGSTLSEGVAACSAYPGAFIALADMPRIRVSTLRALEAEAAPERIVIPTFDGRRGHPVLFGRAWFAELSRLGGDRGAASLLQRYAHVCRERTVDDPGIHLDVDTPDALAALVASDPPGTA